MAEILERVEPDNSRQFRLHQDRYDFACTQLVPGNVLDLGCGVGYGTMMLGNTHGVVRCYGVDIDPGAIKTAKENYNPLNVSYFCADAHDHDNYKYGTFHNIVCLETLEHLSNPGNVLDKLWASRLIVSCPLNEKYGVNPYHKRIYQNKEEFISMIEDHGFHYIGRSFEQPDNWTGVFGGSND